MPRAKGHRRALAMKKMRAKQLDWTPQPPVPEFVPRRGTGSRHCARTWPTSHLTGRQVKLVPPGHPEKKIVFVIGDSHLRAVVDEDVAIPELPFCFSFLSVPGGAAADLRMEVRHLTILWTPDLVCVCAPGNNLTGNRTIGEAAVDFDALLLTVHSRWPKVFVLDFPPRLTIPMDLQELLRNEYHRVAARMGLPYVAVADHLSLNQLNLWCPDSVHLSDTDGMPILIDLLCDAAFCQLAPPPPEPTASPQTPPRPWTPPSPRVAPRVVATGPEPLPRRRHPRGWTVVGQEGKVMCGIEPLSGCHFECAGTPLVRQSDPIPSNAVWFTSAMLDAMEEFAPSIGSDSIAVPPSGQVTLKNAVRDQSAVQEGAQMPQKISKGKCGSVPFLTVPCVSVPHVSAAQSDCDHVAATRRDHGGTGLVKVVRGSFH
uniref:Uncharacterized protein n=1 Tax=Sphaeramia orbicularis TaxID=375764 RepID=A0A672Z6W7_9TELE